MKKLSFLRNLLQRSTGMSKMHRPFPTMKHCSRITIHTCVHQISWIVLLLLLPGFLSVLWEGPWISSSRSTIPTSSQASKPYFSQQQHTHLSGHFRLGAPSLFLFCPPVILPEQPSLGQNSYMCKRPSVQEGYTWSSIFHINVLD